MNISEDLSALYGDPDAEPHNAKQRFMHGVDDPGADIAGSELLLNPHTLKLVMELAYNTAEISDEEIAFRQEVTRLRLVEKVMAFLGNDGELPLDASLSEIRSVMENLPENSRLFEKRESLLSILDEIEEHLKDFTVAGFEPGSMPLTPKHIVDLQRLGVITPERIESLLSAVHYYGALMNYGKPLETPSYTLMDFYTSLTAGEFLDEFVQMLRKTNHLTIAKTLEYLRTTIVPELLSKFNATLEKREMEVRSIGDVYELIPLALEDLLEEADKERDGRKRKKKELLVRAVTCILKEMPEFQSNPFPDDDGLGESWVPDEDE